MIVENFTFSAVCKLDKSRTENYTILSSQRKQKSIKKLSELLIVFREYLYSDQAHISIVLLIDTSNNYSRYFIVHNHLTSLEKDRGLHKLIFSLEEIENSLHILKSFLDQNFLQSF